MPKELAKDRWEKAAARYAEIEKKLKPYVRSAKKSEPPLGESWRRSGELRDDRLHGFRSGV